MIYIAHKMESVYSFSQNIISWKFFTVTMSREERCNCEVWKKHRTSRFSQLCIWLYL